MISKSKRLITGTGAAKAQSASARGSGSRKSTGDGSLEAGRIVINESVANTDISFEEFRTFYRNQRAKKPGILDTQLAREMIEYYRSTAKQTSITRRMQRYRKKGLI